MTRAEILKRLKKVLAEEILGSPRISELRKEMVEADLDDISVEVCFVKHGEVAPLPESPCLCETEQDARFLQSMHIIPDLEEK